MHTISNGNKICVIQRRNFDHKTKVRTCSFVFTVYWIPNIILYGGASPSRLKLLGPNKGYAETLFIFDPVFMDGACGIEREK